MKILHLTDGIPPSTLGGTGQIVCDLAAAQTRAGHTVRILSAGRTGNAESTVQQLSIPALSERWCYYRSVFSRKRGKDVIAAIDAFAPEIVHMHTVSRQLGYAWIKDAAQRRPVIATCHDVSHVSSGKVTGFETALWLTELLRYRWRWNPLRRMMIRSALRHCAAVESVSDALRTYLATFRIQSGRIHNGIDLTRWEPMDRSEARGILKLPEDQFLFLLAGRLGHDKGSTLIAATLPKDAELLVAGAGFGDLFDPIKERTVFFPNQNNAGMRLLYAACNAALVPSRCLDCFPTVCLEAMAMGRAVLASTWGGAKESVIDGATGWIIDPMDEEAWQKRLEWCIEHKSTLEEFGKKGKQRASEHFSVERMAVDYEDVYRSALAHD